MGLKNARYAVVLLSPDQPYVPTTAVPFSPRLQVGSDLWWACILIERCPARNALVDHEGIAMAQFEKWSATRRTFLALSAIFGLLALVSCTNATRGTAPHHFRPLSHPAERVGPRRSSPDHGKSVDYSENHGAGRALSR